MRALPAKHMIVLLTTAVMAVAMVLVLIVRWQAAPLPLERDEGEYALMGQLILDGVPPYAEAANMKLPGTYYAYAAILSVFGQTAAGVRMGLMVVTFLSGILVYLIARPLLGDAGAALAGAASLIMSADLSVLGLFSHATHFVVLFALAGTGLLLRSPGAKRELPLVFFAGICFGLSFLMKQSGAFFALFGFSWLFVNALRHRPVAWSRFLLKSGCLAAGIVAPYALVLAFVAGQGRDVLARFWFWTVEYARVYAAMTAADPGTAVESLRSAIAVIVRGNPALWSLALAGAIGLWFTKRGREAAPFLVLFTACSFLAVCPGLRFREHYFVQVLPAAALLAGSGLLAIEALAARYTGRAQVVSLVFLVGATAVSLMNILALGHALAASSPGQFVRSIYKANPFPESVRIADYIAANTSPRDRIAILGSEPQIYFYAHRRPATEHIYMYGLTEEQPFALRMQEELIAQVERSAPRFIVFVSVTASWLKHPDSEQKLFSWMKKYIARSYRPVMAAEIYPDQTVWRTEQELRVARPFRSNDRLLVFRRRDS